MPVTVRSFAKVNLGLRIGARREDGFHDLRTVYQTIALHDVIRVQVVRGKGIEVHCDDPRVPKDESNTCYRIAEKATAALKARGRVIIEIEKRLPVQGGLGAASSNAVAVLLGLERAVKKELPAPERFRIAAEVGSDLPLFLVGGTVLGVGRGEEVNPLPDFAAVDCVVATTEIGVSTPQAFKDWDEQCGPAAELRSAWTAEGGRPHAGSYGSTEGGRPHASGYGSAEGGRPHASNDSAESGRPHAGSVELTGSRASDRMNELGQVSSAWLSTQSKAKTGKGLSGVSAVGRGRAESPLLGLVRTGIENDFEQVVFPQYPELREVKRALVSGGAFYASLSGSGSAVYGLFSSRERAKKAAARLRKEGVEARVTKTLTRRQYWAKIFD